MRITVRIFRSVLPVFLAYFIGAQPVMAAVKSAPIDAANMPTGGVGILGSIFHGVTLSAPNLSLSLLTTPSILTGNISVVPAGSLSVVPIVQPQAQQNLSVSPDQSIPVAAGLAQPQLAAPGARELTVSQATLALKEQKVQPAVIAAAEAIAGLDQLSTDNSKDAAEKQFDVLTNEHQITDVATVQDASDENTHISRQVLTVRDQKGDSKNMNAVEKLVKGRAAPSLDGDAGIKKFSRILVLVAMDVEKEAILAKSQAKRVRQRLPLGLEVYQLSRGKTKIYLASAGIGTVNAALAVATLSEKLAIDSILMLGVGGALSPVLDIGDMVIGTQVVQHDCRISGGDGCELMAPGEPYLSVPAAKRTSPFMASDPVWSRWLANVTKGGHSFKGTILSGNEFVGNPARKIELANLVKDALLVDMEAAGVAQIARKLNIPFGIIKTVSDRLNPDGSVTTDYKRFLRQAAEQSRHIFERLLSVFSA